MHNRLTNIVTDSNGRTDKNTCVEGAESLSARMKKGGFGDKVELMVRWERKAVTMLGER